MQKSFYFLLKRICKFAFKNNLISFIFFITIYWRQHKLLENGCRKIWLNITTIAYLKDEWTGFTIRSPTWSHKRTIRYISYRKSLTGGRSISEECGCGYKVDHSQVPNAIICLNSNTYWFLRRKLQSNVA